MGLVFTSIGPLLQDSTATSQHPETATCNSSRLLGHLRLRQVVPRLLFTVTISAPLADIGHEYWSFTSAVIHPWPNDPLV